MEVTEIKNKISSGISLIDESIGQAQDSNLSLSMQLGIDGLAFCILDLQQNKYLALQTYTFQGIYSYESLKENVENIVLQNPLLRKKFKSSSFSIIHNKSTLIPNPLFESADKEKYLRFNHELTDEEVILMDNLKNMDAKNIYAFPLAIKAPVEKLFPGIQVKHFSSSLINSLLLHYKNHTSRKIIVHVQLTHFEIIVTEDKKLVLYNSFHYATAEDFVYYLLFVFEQLKLNPETADVVLIGEIERNSTIYSLLTKYVRNVKFGERQENIAYSYKLNEIPKHFYYNLFSQYLCV